MTDPISDFIVRITNASAVKKASITVPHSKLKLAVAQALKSAGFVGAIEEKGKTVSTKALEITLLYKENGMPRVTGVKRISKPGRRMYTNVSSMRPVRYGHGSLILSTPKGIMTDADARRARVGGESLFEIW